MLPESRLRVTSVDSAMVDADGLLLGAAGEGNESNMGVSRDDRVHRNAEVERKARQRTVKRAKISGAPPSKKQKSSIYKNARQKKSLSLLPTMPLDILFEIFGLLNPRDMIHLTMTSKMFRQTLLSRGTVTVWKAIRERFNAPEPPHGMSEPAWVALLFGNVCNNCGAKNIENIDFRLRRRLCTGCKKENLIVESRLNGNFPGLDKSLLDLIPWTRFGKWSHHYPSAIRHFWVPDVKNIIQEVALIARDASKVNLESFKKQRREYIETIHSAATGHNDWLKKIALERQLDKVALLDERREAIYDRFIQLGYETQDISCIKWEPQVRRSNQLTDRIWQRILPILQPKVQNYKTARLEREYARLKGSRRVIIGDLYESFRKSLPPSQWRYLPRTVDIFELGPIFRFINAPLEVADTADDFKPALESLPELLSDLSDAKHRKFMDILAMSTNFLPTQPEDRPELDGNSQRVASPSQEVTHSLNLATSVFECIQIPFTSHSSPCILVGVEEISTHHCELLSWGTPSSDYSVADFAFPPTSSVTFSRRGSETTRLLVQLVGLDAKTTSAQAMDDKNLRYTCDLCTPETYLDAPRSRVYTWRTAIAHDIADRHNGMSLAKALLNNHWKVLPDIEAEEVKEQERTDGKWISNDWTCGHCSVYMSNLQDRSRIIQHLKEEHEIVDPKEPEDLFFFERYIKPFHRNIFYPVPDYSAPGPIGPDFGFDASGLFRPDGDIDFERDFGQWFNPDDVAFHLP